MRENQSGKLDNLRFELDRLAEYSDNAILDEIRRVASAVEKPRLSRPDFESKSRVGFTTLCGRFGSWRKALAAAGLEHLCAPERPSKKSSITSRAMTDDAILDELRRVARAVASKSFVSILPRAAVFPLDAFR